MARIGDVEFNISSVSEDSAVKLSTHEIAIYPHTFGEIYKVYGTTQRRWSLTASETEGFNTDVYVKLERMMRIGKSVRIDLPEIDRYSVGFITAVKRTKTQGAIQEFQVDIDEGLRNPINGCESIEGWESNGTLTLDNVDFKEGEASVKCSGSPDAGVALYAKAPVSMPPRLLSCDWIAFWFKTDNITDLASVVVKFILNSENYASIDVTDQITQANKWILIRFKRENMTVTGTLNWNLINAFKLEKTHNTAQTHSFWIDDICAFQ